MVDLLKQNKIDICEHIWKKWEANWHKIIFVTKIVKTNSFVGNSIRFSIRNCCTNLQSTNTKTHHN